MSKLEVKDLNNFNKTSDLVKTDVLNYQDLINEIIHDYNDLLASNMDGALYIQMLNNYLELINNMKSNLGKMLNISNTLINAYKLYCEVKDDVQ